MFKRLLVGSIKVGVRKSRTKKNKIFRQKQTHK